MKAFLVSEKQPQIGDEGEVFSPVLSAWISCEVINHCLTPKSSEKSLFWKFKNPLKDQIIFSLIMSSDIWRKNE